MVLDQGRIVEFDTPAALLAISGGYFAKLVDNTGSSNAALLRGLAQEKAAKGQVDFKSLIAMDIKMEKDATASDVPNETSVASGEVVKEDIDANRK